MRPGFSAGVTTIELRKNHFRMDFFSRIYVYFRVHL